MKTTLFVLLTACMAIAFSLALFQPANWASASEYKAAEPESAVFVLIEPVPEPADDLGEVVLDDFAPADELHASAQVDAPARTASRLGAYPKTNSYVSHGRKIVNTSAASGSALKVSAEESDVGVDYLCDYDDCENCGDCMDACACQPCVRHWLRADYLLWWTRGSSVPPLVTTSTDQSDNGILGQPTTSILYGGSRESSVGRSAPRLTLGYWFDCCQTCGVEFDYFNLGQYNNDYDEYSDGETLLARPIYSVLAQRQGSELVAKDNIVEGRVRVDADDYFQSFGILWRRNICCHEPCGCVSCCDEPRCGCDTCGCGGGCNKAGCCAGRPSGLLRGLFYALKNSDAPICYRVDFIAGYRNYRLDDNLSVRENLVTLPGDPYTPAGTTFDIDDTFRATNEFHGGELGLTARLRRGCWTLDLLAKMAMGNNSSIVAINGSTDIDRPGDEPVHYDSGILALQTNAGRYHHDQFIIIPQFGAEIGYDLTCCLRAYCGYNFIYWARVYRAAEAIDTNVNTSYIPPVVDPHGEPAPTFSFTDSDFWAQGLNFGLEWQF